MTEYRTVNYSLWSTSVLNDDGLDGLRYEVNDSRNFLICIVDDPDDANLIATAPKLLKVAARTLELLTDLGIDLDGEDEELIAGIRYDLDEVVNEARGRADQ